MGCSTDHMIESRRISLWRPDGYDRNSTEPIIPKPPTYPLNNVSNLFPLFGGTYKVPSISPSLLIHAPSANFGFGVTICT